MNQVRNLHQFVMEQLSSVDLAVALVGMSFLQRHRGAFTSGEITRMLANRGIHVSRLRIEESCKWLCKEGYLVGNPSTGKYFFDEDDLDFYGCAPDDYDLFGS